MTPTVRRSAPARFLRVRRFSIAIAAAAFLPTSGSVAEAQGPTRSSFYPETDRTAEALLNTAASHIGNEEWESAIELYRRVIDQHPDALTDLFRDGRPAAPGDDPIPGVTVFVNVREYVHSRLARLPPEALAHYRRRVDREAEHWYREGLAGLDPEPLRRVIDDFFCSSFGDEAAELLADLAFQDARFDEAIALYRRLLPSPPGEEPRLVHPDPDAEAARVAAKILLCRAARGDMPQPDEVARFAAAYPEAEGGIAGRDGRLAESVARALVEDRLSPPEEIDDRWSTFARVPSRSGRARHDVDFGQQIWDVPLRVPFDDAANLNAAIGDRTASGEESASPFFPVLMGDEILITDGTQVIAFPLDADQAGGPGPAEPRPSWRGGDSNSIPIEPGSEFRAEARTLTVHGDRVYARIRARGPILRGREMQPSSPSEIIALERDAGSDPVWRVEASELVGRDGGGVRPMATGQLTFGGAPLADDEGVYVTVLKPGVQTLAWVAALDPTTGLPRWARYVCAASTPELAQVLGFGRRGVVTPPQLSPRLLSMSGSTLFYQTDLGALASIDARTGRLNWLATYPRDPELPLRSQSAGRSPRPAVVSDDLVVIAPNDSPRVWAYERTSGRLAWQADLGDGRAEHLLGIVDDRVVVTGEAVWTIELETGRVASRWPEGRTLEPGFGRGLLTDSQILWPTRDRVYFLDPSTGRPEAGRPPIDLATRYGCGGGNLFSCEGYVILAEADRLRVFCEFPRAIERIEQRIADEPEEARHRYRLARAAIALGDDERALSSLDEAIARATAFDRVDGRPLRGEAEAMMFQLLMDRGHRLIAAQPDLAAREFARAVSAASDIEDRVRAALDRAAAQERAGDPAGAAETLQEMLMEPSARGRTVTVGDGRTIRVELLIARRLRDAIDRHGRAIYRPFDEQAARLLRRGIDRDDPRALNEVVRSYPASTSAPHALLGLGRRDENRGDWSGAARNYSELITSASETLTRARGLLGAARCYLALGRLDDARRAYKIAADRFGDVVLPEEENSVSAISAAQLEAMNRGEVLDSRPEVPLRRVATSAFGPDDRPLDLCGASPSPETMKPVLLASPGSLRLLEPLGDEVRWSIDFDVRGFWHGFVGGRLVVVTPERMLGLDLADGSVIFEYPANHGPRLALGDPIWPGVGAHDDGRDFVPPEARRRGEGPSGRLIGGLDRGPGRDRPHPAGPSGPDDGAPGDQEPASRLLHDARAWGDFLFVFAGDDELICFDAAAGMPRWTYRYDEGAINPLIGFGLSRIALQGRGPNAIVVLNADDGRVLRRVVRPENDPPWRRSPHAVAPDRVALVTALDAIELFDLEAGRMVWRADAPTDGPGHRAARMMGNGDRLYAVTDRRIRRLDPTDGQVIWSYPIAQLRVRDDDGDGSFTSDSSTFYWLGPIDSVLRAGALDLDTGRPRWTRPLTGDPGESWDLAMAGGCLVAARLDDGVGSTRDDPALVHLIDRGDGALVQRLLVPGGGGDRRLRVDPGGLRVVGDAGQTLLSGPGAAPEADGRRADR